MKTMIRFFRQSIFITILILLAGSLSAQEVIEVKYISARMSEGQQPAYQAKIPKASLKTIQQNWVKKLQENVKAKVNEISHEWVLANVVKGELTKDTVTIYTIFIEKDSIITMSVFIKIDSAFFSPSDDKTDLASDKIDNSIKNYIRNFAVAQYKLAVTGELEAEQKMLKDLEADLSQLEKDKDNLDKDISSLENSIEKTERTISDLDQQIELKRQEGMSHKVSMQAILGEEEKKAAQEKDKSLEKELNKLEKERSKAKNDISDMESKIGKNEKAIGDNEKLQEETTEWIEAQKQVITQVQTVLNGIK